MFDTVVYSRHTNPPACLSLIGRCPWLNSSPVCGSHAQASISILIKPHSFSFKLTTMLPPLSPTISARLSHKCNWACPSHLTNYHLTPINRSWINFFFFFFEKGSWIISIPTSLAGSLSFSPNEELILLIVHGNIAPSDKSHNVKSMMGAPPSFGYIAGYFTNHLQAHSLPSSHTTSSQMHLWQPFSMRGQPILV